MNGFFISFLESRAGKYRTFALENNLCKAFAAIPGHKEMVMYLLEKYPVARSISERFVDRLNKEVIDTIMNQYPVDVLSSKKNQLIRKYLNRKGSLKQHLMDINKQAHKMLEQLIDGMKRSEGITESLKSRKQLEWLQRMNSIKHRAEEIILSMSLLLRSGSLLENTGNIFLLLYT